MIWGAMLQLVMCAWSGLQSKHTTKRWSFHPCVQSMHACHSLENCLQLAQLAQPVLWHYILLLPTWARLGETSQQSHLQILDEKCVPFPFKRLQRLMIKTSTSRNVRHKRWRGDCVRTLECWIGSKNRLNYPSLWCMGLSSDCGGTNSRCRGTQMYRRTHTRCGEIWALVDGNAPNEVW